MTETPAPAPSTPVGLRWFVRFSQWVWWLVLGFWAVLLLATIAMHVLIVPRIIDWRPQIEQMASQAWGVKITIGELESVSDGWVPSFELRDFVIRNQQDVEVLRLPQLRATLSPTSLLRMSLERIELEQPEIELRRSVDGRWRLAGLDMSSNEPSGMADWLLRQPEIHVHHGRLRLVDEVLAQAPLNFTEVDLQLRNGLRSHQWRMDVNPPQSVGQRISLQGQFTRDLFDNHASDLSTWRGQLFAQTAQIDLSPFAPYLQQAGWQLQSAQGWLRAWVEVDHGLWRQPTVDLSLSNIQLKSADKPEPLSIAQLAGRVLWQPWADGSGHELRMQEFLLAMPEEEVWRTGDLRLAWRNEGDAWAQTGELQVDSVSLAVLGRVAERLPLNAEWRAQLHQAKPSGQLSQLDLRWFDVHTPAFQYNAKGSVSNLVVQSSAPNSPPTALWWPGTQGAQVQFQMNEHGGKAQVSIQNGSMSLVDWLEDPRIPLQQLQGDVSWERLDKQWQLHIKQAQVLNEYAQGEFDLTWKEGLSRQSFGHLDLQAKVQRLDARALHRYLPTDMPASGRRYLRDALLGGQFNQAKLVIQGPLDNFPFAKTNDGVFTIHAPFQQATFQYVPNPAQPLLTARKQPPTWPQLQQLSGELQLNRNRLWVKSGTARIGAGAAIQVPKLEVHINDLDDMVVDVNAQFSGGLSDALFMVNNSPLADQFKPYLGAVVANGMADHQLRLSLPVDKLDLAKFQGSVTLLGNDVLWQSGWPRFEKARGVLTYSESGLSVNGVRMQLLGGEAKLDGGLRFNDSPTDSSMRLVLQGAVSAEALQQAQELGRVNSLATVLSGSTQYVASLGLRQGRPEFVITSNMQGMALNLPAPLDKRKEDVWPLRIDNEWLKSTGKSSVVLEQIRLSLDQVLSLDYVRDIGPAVPTVLRGQISLGQPGGVKDVPDNGVALQIKHAKFNADDWQQALSPWTDNDKTGSADSPWQAYSPNRLQLQASEFVWLGRTFHQLQASADKQGAKHWRIQAKATELQGQAEYRPAQDNASARLVARLNHLTIPPSMLEEVETALSDSPKDMPALDIVIDNLELRGVKWGRAEVDGFARTGATGAREWVLNKMNLTMPEASFQSKGQWGGASKAAAKRSQLDFTLQIQDSGELLERLGFKGALRHGKGRMAGQVGWQGSPFSPDYNSMSGQFNINLERGQFLKADPGVTRLLGVLSLQSLPRRLKLDFSDLFSEGFLFDFVRGDVLITQGMASTNNLQMKGVSAAVLIEGKADIQRETQDIKVVVVPELNAGTASLVYSAINPVVGITSFLAQYFLRRPLIKSNTEEFRVQGSWKDPKVVKVDTPPASKTPATATP